MQEVEHAMTRDTSQTALGGVLVASSALIFGLAGVLTKSIASDPMAIVCWRGLVGFVLVGLYVAWRGKGRGRAAFALGWRGWLIAGIGALASVAFIAAFKSSYVANVTIIYATVPLAAALLGRLVLGESLRGRTLVAALACLAGVALMVGAGLGRGTATGDALALAMTLLSALYVVMIRRFRDIPVVWAGAVSAAMLFVLGWFVTTPTDIGPHDAILLAAFGVSFAAGVILWTEGARLIPAAETGLLGLLEVPAGILLAVLFLAERPPAATVGGGLVVLAAVIWHAWRDRRDLRARPTPAA